MPGLGQFADDYLVEWLEESSRSIVTRKSIVSNSSDVKIGSTVDIRHGKKVYKGKIIAAGKCYRSVLVRVVFIVTNLHVL